MEISEDVWIKQQQQGHGTWFLIQTNGFLLLTKIYTSKCFEPEYTSKCLGAYGESVVTECLYTVLEFSHIASQFVTRKVGHCDSS